MIARNSTLHPPCHIACIVSVIGNEFNFPQSTHLKYLALAMASRFGLMASQQAFYDARDSDIDKLFEEATADADWDDSIREIDTALADASLPRICRAQYHAIRARNSPNAAEDIQRAKESLEDMREVLRVEGKTEEQCRC